MRLAIVGIEIDGPEEDRLRSIGQTDIGKRAAGEAENVGVHVLEVEGSLGHPDLDRVVAREALL